MTSLVSFAVILLLAASVAVSAPQLVEPKAGAPRAGWDAGFFDYAAPRRLVVEESTPTAAQTGFYSRPRPLSAARAPVDRGGAQPVTLAGMEIVHLRFRDVLGDDVPALLCKPAGVAGPLPVVVALHGINSFKAQVCGQVAPALTKQGFAVLAFDLPLHGERVGDPRSLLGGLANGDLQRTVGLCRQAVLDLRQCIDVAEQRADLDTTRGVILAGYSMGALIDSVAGPADPRVKAMLLMVGGTPEFPPMLALVPGMAALQPQLALPHFARPLLMLNGAGDTTVTRDMGERLFSSATEPKEQRWYDCGHHLPDRAYEDGAAWVKKTWDAIRAAK